MKKQQTKRTDHKFKKYDDDDIANPGVKQTRSGYVNYEVTARPSIVYKGVTISHDVMTKSVDDKSDSYDRYIAGINGCFYQSRQLERIKKWIDEYNKSN